MLDHLIKGGTVVDGTGRPGVHRRRRHPRRPHRRHRRDRRGRPRDDRRRRAGRHARLRRSAHPLRRPAVLGPGRDAVERARRHDGHRRQLRVHARAAPARRRRLHPPDDGEGRGHAARRARAGRGLELAHLRRVPRPARLEDRGQRRVPRRPLRAPPLRDGRRRGRQRGDARADRRDGRRCSTSRSRPAGSASRPRSRARTPTATASRWRRAGRPPRSSSRCAGSSSSTRAPRSRAMTDGCLDRFSDDEIELFIAMSAAARRPINWNVLTVDSREPDRVPHQLAAGDRAAEAGARIVALTMPVLVPMNMSFLNYCALFLIPGWTDVLGLPVPERIAKLRDPETRQRMLEQSAAPEAGVFQRLADFANYIIGDTYSAANEGLKGRKVADIAAERGTEPFDTLIDIVRGRRPAHGPLADPARRRRRVVGAAPAGVGRPPGDARRLRRRRPPRPHVRRAVHHPLPRRHAAGPQAGVARAGGAAASPTSRPGCSGCGTAAGWSRAAHADVVVFDPETIGAEHATLVHDLPGDTPRLTAESHGVTRVFVNGDARGRRRRGHRRPPRQDPPVRPRHRNREHRRRSSASSYRQVGSGLAVAAPPGGCAASEEVDVSYGKPRSSAVTRARNS